MQDTSLIKEKIVSLLRLKGPTLPVHVAKEINMSMLFASAFLSELLSDKRIKLSNMKIGSSSLYFIPGHEPQLEKFSNYLKSKEKDAFVLLKERKFLNDSELEPAIRVAMRSIKDFAIPMRKENSIVWKYFTAPESEFRQEIKPIEEHQYIKAKPKVFDENERQISEKIIKEIIKEKESVEKIPEEPVQIIVQEKEPEQEIKKEHHKKETHPKKEKQKRESKAKKANKKKEENFFNQIKEFLAKKGIEILDIKDFKNDEALLKIKKNNSEELLFIFNKKKITEKEILKAHKKSSEDKLKYSILSLGESPKKLNDLISAIRNLSSIDKIE